MINIRTLQKIKNGDGLTLKGGRKIEYKSGYQVATDGKTETDITKVRQAIKSYNGDCGLWFYNGVWYIDKCHRVASKKQAVTEGKQYNQISVFDWRRKRLIYC